MMQRSLPASLPSRRGRGTVLGDPGIAPSVSRAFGYTLHTCKCVETRLECVIVAESK